jgi:pimeloyl-ACP methyl ester carboxylesterase
MVSDLKEFIKQHDLKDPILLGHSMGGKAVMATALDSPELVSKLIVVDMPPVILKLSNNFSTYIKGMKAIEDADVKKQSEADKILSEYESNVGVRMFLLTNLKKIDGKYRFRIPYQTLGESLASVGYFSFPNNAQFDHPTLFIAGGASPYKPPFLDKQKKKEIDALFPNNELKIVDGAGHWGKFNFEV